MKRTCVIIRGLVRTWDSAKFSIFESLKFLTNPYFIFATWDESYFGQFNNVTGTVELDDKHFHYHIDESVSEKIRNDFSDKNLIDLVVFDKSSLNAFDIKRKAYSEESQYSAFLRYYANLVKRKFEIENFTFDEVIEIRPDCFILPIDGPILVNRSFIDDYVVYTCGELGIKNSVLRPLVPEFKEMQFQMPFIDDNIFICNSFTHDILSQQFLYYCEQYENVSPKMLNGHSLVSTFCQCRNLIIQNRVPEYFAGYTILRKADNPYTKVLTQQSRDIIEAENLKFVQNIRMNVNT